MVEKTRNRFGWLAIIAMLFSVAAIFAASLPAYADEAEEAPAAHAVYITADADAQLSVADETGNQIADIWCAAGVQTHAGDFADGVWSIVYDGQKIAEFAVSGADAYIDAVIPVPQAPEPDEGTDSLEEGSDDDGEADLETASDEMAEEAVGEAAGEAAEPDAEEEAAEVAPAIAEPKATASAGAPGLVLKAAPAKAAPAKAAGQDKKIEGKCTVAAKTHDVDNDEFEVVLTFDDGSNVKLTGYCMDAGLPCPSDGTYSYTGTLKADGSYVIYIDTTKAKVPDWQVDTGEGCQRVKATLKPQEAKIKVVKKTSDEKAVEGRASTTYSLKGAVYALYTSKDDADAKNKNYVETATTNASGIAKFSGLDCFRDYWVTEIEAPQGYKLSSAVHHCTGLEPKEEWETTFLETPVKGTVQIIKSSKSTETTAGNPNYSLKDAEFSLYRSYDEATGKVSDPFRDADGNIVRAKTKYDSKLGQYVATFNDVPLGRWYAREYQAPQGYVRDTKVTAFVLESEKSGHTYEFVDEPALHFADAPVTGRIEIVKKSADPGLTEGNGCYSLAGAQFQIIDGKGNVVETLTTDGYGKAKSSELPLGGYTVVEVKAPQGFALPEDGATQTIALACELLEGRYSYTIVSHDALTFTDKPMMDPARVKLTKKSVDKDGNVTETPVPFAQYTFEYYAGPEPDGAPMRTWILQTDGKGVAGLSLGMDPFYVDGVEYRYLVSGDEFFFDGDLISMPAGTLKIYESLSPAGYAVSGQIWTSTLTFDEDGNPHWSGMDFDDETIEATDEHVFVKVALDKKGQGLIDVSGNSAYTLAGAVYGIYRDAACTDEIARITTDANGHAESGELDYAETLYVKELVQPRGYALDTAVYTVEATQAQIDSRKDFTMALQVADAELSGSAEVTKRALDKDGNETGKVLEGAEFTLYDANGKAVASKLTGKDGKASFGKLAIGSYTLTETKAPEGFALDKDNSWSFEIAEKDCLDGTAEFAYDAWNAPTVLKMDKKSVTREGEGPMMGTKWHIWATDKDGSTVFETDATTDENGSFEIEEIPHGDGLTYHVQETWCDELYNIDSEIHEFTVDRCGYIEGESVYTVTAYNYKTDIRFSKFDSETGEVIRDTLFGLYKWEGEGEPVQGEHEGWKLVGKILSDADGNGVFEGVKWGDYKLQELVANPAYLNPGESELTTEFYLHIDATNPFPELQVVYNEPIHIKTWVDKDTIERTSIGLVYKDKDGNIRSAVGNEKMPYRISFGMDSETFGDEYWIEDRCEFVDEPYGLRITDLWLPIVGNDTDGLLWLLLKTNLTGEGTATGMSFTQPELHGNPLCDGTARFDASGWDFIGRFSATSGEKVDLASILKDGEFITKICLCFGAVDPGFAATSPLTYLVVATHELIGDDDFVIPNSVTSHVTRNWSKTTITPDGPMPSGDEPHGLTDDDEDTVQTRIVTTFDHDSGFTPGGGEKGNWTTNGSPATGDGSAAVLAVLLGMVICSAAGLIIASRRIREREAQ